MARGREGELAARAEAAAAELEEARRTAEEELERYRAREVLVEGQLAAEKQAREEDRERWKRESLELAQENDEAASALDYDREELEREMERAQVAHADEVSELEQARYPPYIAPILSPPYLHHISHVSPPGEIAPRGRDRCRGRRA